MDDTTPPLNKVELAHQMYRKGRYSEALGFYWDAVVVAKTKAQKIALHSNRAACFLKLRKFKLVRFLPPFVVVEIVVYLIVYVSLSYLIC